MYDFERSILVRISPKDLERVAAIKGFTFRESYQKEWLAIADDNEVGRFMMLRFIID
jgi:hypothetical protein